MSINSSSGKYNLQMRKNFSSTSTTSVLSIIRNSLPISAIVVSSIMSKSSLSEVVSFLGFLMVAMNRSVSTKNRRVLFPDFFFDFTSHLANYVIDIDVFEIFLKLFRQFFYFYFFDDQKVIFN